MENWREGRRCSACLVAFLLGCVDKLQECGQDPDTVDVPTLHRIEHAKLLLSRYASHSEQGFDAVGRSRSPSPLPSSPLLSDNWLPKTEEQQDQDAIEALCTRGHILP